MSLPSRKNPSAFTLVELMIVVAIIGILASIAVPSFRNYGYRSKQAERATILRSLKNAIDDYYTREGAFPTDWGGGNSYLNLFSANPDWSPGTSKRPWRLGVPDWSKLPFEVEGSVYYTYYGYAFTWPGTRYYVLIAIGDLDGDMQQDTLQKIYQYDGYSLLKFNLAGQWACDDCSYAYQWPYPATTF